MLTPHAAFYSEEAPVVELQRKAAEQVVAALAGRTPAYAVNADVLSTAQPASTAVTPGPVETPATSSTAPSDESPDSSAAKTSFTASSGRTIPTTGWTAPGGHQRDGAFEVVAVGEAGPHHVDLAEHEARGGNG